ncbi:hypothetical protein AAZX31_11G203600 [Glycine max]
MRTILTTLCRLTSLWPPLRTLELQILPQYLTAANRDAGVVSSEFLLWEQQDQLLLSWLQSIILPREHVSRYHHVDIILDGLPDEFESLVPFVSGKFESLSIDEVMTLLLAHETQIAHKKSHASSVTSINLTEEAKPNLVHQDSHTQAYVAQGFGSSSHFGSSTYL